MPWNKGLNKKINASVLKTSETMKRRKLDNFKVWRDSMRVAGKFASNTPLKQDGNLAELIGLILGDGSIHKYLRTEGLRIVLPTSHPGIELHYADIIEKVFSKRPSIIKRKDGNCVDLRLYGKYMSERLGIPSGARADYAFKLPPWISKNKDFVIRYLRGLYEAEGSFSVHKLTYTYKFSFKNQNDALLDSVYECVSLLGFHPHRSKYQIQVSKKAEVFELKELLRFRMY